MKYVFRLFIVFVALSLIWGALSVLTPTKTPVITPKRAPAVQAVYATGTVEPTNMIPIAPRVTARITNILIDEGATVTAGTVLGTLEDTDVQNQVTQAEAQLNLAQTSYNRIAPLTAKGALSRRSLDEADATLKSAVADLDRIRAQAGYMQLIAPTDGTVIRRDGEIGELAAAGTPVFYMAANTSLRITTEVDEEDIPLVKPGQPVLIQSDPFGQKIFNGHVTAITPKGDATARSYRVRIGFDDQNVPLMIGMTAETNIITARDDNALMIPISAINDNAVLVTTNGTVSKKPITTGIRTTRAAAVRSGVTERDQIVQTYDAKLIDKKITPEPTPFDVNVADAP